jgi:hypothetical protein
MIVYRDTGSTDPARFMESIHTIHLNPKGIRTLVWQDESPNHSTLRDDLRRYFGKHGVVGWSRSYRCWFVRILTKDLSQRDKMYLRFGLTVPGEGRTWFEIRITPAETFLTIATNGQTTFLVESFVAGLIDYFVLARNAAIIEN